LYRDRCFSRAGLELRGARDIWPPPEAAGARLPLSKDPMRYNENSRCNPTLSANIAIEVSNPSEAPLNRLPTSLTRCKVIGAQQQLLVTEGLRVLLDASLLGGAGLRHSSYRLLLASLTVPDGRLGAFRRRLGVMQDELAPDPLQYLADVERKLRVEVPAKIKRIAPFLAQGEYYRFMELSHTRVLTTMIQANRLDAQVTASDLVRIGERHSAIQPALAHQDTSAFDFWSQPIPELIKAAHSALVKSNGDDRDLDGHDLDSLLILGASCAALRTIQECKWCHRWCLPGSPLCSEHALSKHAESNPNERQNRYRKAESTHQRLRKWRDDKDGDVTSARKVPLLRPAHLADDLRLYVARVLWRATSSDEQEIAARLVQVLRQPHIAAVLGFDMDELTTSGVDDFLRRRLEPGQWLPVHWEWKVWKAVLLTLEDHRKVLAAEEASTQGLEARLDAALQIAANHCCHSLTEIARHLNVKQSTVSQWLRRSSSIKVQQLRELIEHNNFLRPSQPSTT